MPPKKLGSSKAAHRLASIAVAAILVSSQFILSSKTVLNLSLYSQDFDTSNGSGTRAADDPNGSAKVLLLCVGFGGLTNIKQRLFGCLQRGKKIASMNKTKVKYLLPWVISRPHLLGAGPHIPLDSTFNVSIWIDWIASHGFEHQQLLFEAKYHGKTNTSFADYQKELRNWAESSNVSVVKQSGDLVPTPPSFSVNAFILRDDILSRLQNNSTIRVENECLVHARIERDWQAYNRGLYYVPFDQILTFIKASKLCNESIFVLTAAEDEVRKTCPSCIILNKTGFLYVQASAIDFQTGLKSNIFFGEMHSSFSHLIMSSRGFQRSFTYSSISGEACVRQVLLPNTLCRDCQHLQLFGGVTPIQNDCFHTGSKSVSF